MIGPARPRVGVVVLDYEQFEHTSRCLTSVAAAGDPPSAVALVCNGRGASEIDLPADLFIHVIEPGRNLGCAGGRNTGLTWLVQHAHCDLLVTLDNDATCDPQFFTHLASRIPQHLEAQAPMIVNSLGDVWSSGGAVAASGEVTQLCDAVDEEREVHWAPGACLIFTASTWQACGPFDEWMSFLFEDIDWCRRIRLLGGRIIVRGDLLVHHDPHQSLGGQWSSNRVRFWAQNGTVFRASVAGRRELLGWLAREAGLAGRDAVRGYRRESRARIQGLVEGTYEATRRSDM